ncbi:glycosyltransferase [Parvularcula sp. IMCC14364]|uniref:glycosyltransferase n=1 Tax=Parvularcula sp. IMCC14364 TaxID=3067902 RepID=UPI002741DACE|nr:glycosyltransferase [Parvularcula sp. IMCC14364]
MTKLPTISIVTPSYNQAEFVDKCLQSVATQSSLPHEHIIMDSVSSDGTADKLRSYAAGKPWVHLMVEKDKGQMDVINRGFAQATGDIITWLNTDDFFIDENVLRDVARYFHEHPEADFIYGGGEFLDQHGVYLQDVYINAEPDMLRSRLMNSVGILQPANFFRREVFTDIGPCREDLSYCFDYEYWLRAVHAGKTFVHVDRKFTQATLHQDSKTIGNRAVSLEQTTRTSKDYYGFASYQWIDKLARCLTDGSDGIVRDNWKSSSNLGGKRKEVFMAYNGDKQSLSSLFSMAHLPDSLETLKYVRSQNLISTNRVYISSFDEGFFASGLTMIAGLQKYHEKPYPAFVYDLGLTQAQRDILHSLENVFVLDFDRQAAPFFEDYFSVQTYGFKAYAIWHARHYLEAGDNVVWMDAGIYPLSDMQTCFSEIEEHDILLVDHSDKSIWPVWNSTFTSDACVAGMQASAEELMAPHLRAGFLGYKVGGRYSNLFQEAFDYSLQPEILAGDKHPEPPVYQRRDGGTSDERNRAVEDKAWQATLSPSKIRELFGYFGHRHDQAIISILAARHKAPYRSAQEFCVADNLSSASSKSRWKSGSDNQDYQVSTEIPEFYRNSAAAMMQHRGLFLNTTGLKFIGSPATKPAVVLGNGPSLAGFDFDRFKVTDVFGMNAAYRYWDEINWYPQYYCCLDLVVGLSHKAEIKRLIETSHKTGIRLFMLRQNLIEEIGAVKNQERVLNFDELKRYSAVLQAPTITTGSHTAAFAAMLGYRNIYVLGVDCNYKEVVDGAKEVGVGTELEIVEEKENPNYFFKGYQRKGDKYNIPNPNRNIHLDAWREVAGPVMEQGAQILNANLDSKVDALDFCRFEDVEKGGVVEVIPAFDILDGEASSVAAERGMMTDTVSQQPAVTPAKPAQNTVRTDSSVQSSAAVREAKSPRGETRTAARTPGTMLLQFLPARFRPIIAKGMRLSKDILKRRFPLFLLYGGALLLTLGLAFLTPLGSTPWPWLVLAGLVLAGFAGGVAFGFLYTKRRITQHFQNLTSTLRSEIAARAPTPVVQRLASEQRKLEAANASARTQLTLELQSLRELLDSAQVAQESLRAVQIAQESKITDFETFLDDTAAQIANSLESKLGSEDIEAFRHEVANVYNELDQKAGMALVSELESILSAKARNDTSDLESKLSDIENRFANDLSERQASLEQALEKLRNSLEQKSDGNQLSTLENDVAQKLQNMSGELAALEKRVSDSVEQDRISEFQAESRRQVADVAEKISLLQGRMEDLSSQDHVAQLEGEIRAQLNELLNKNSSFDEITDYLSDRITQMEADVTKDIENLNLTVAEEKSRRQSLVTQVGELEKTGADIHVLTEKVDAFSHVATQNDINFNSFDRALTPRDVAEIKEKWAGSLGLKLEDKNLYYAAKRICELESSSRGRVATDIQDAVLRSLVAGSVRGRSLSVLEIGTLFGVGAGAIYDHCRDRFDTVKLTMIDPLDGYYGNDASDILTGLKVGESNLRQNMQAMHVSDHDYTLIKRYSHEDSAIREASDDRYDVIVIDADHAYTSIKLDFENYAPLVKRGGYIIFDDYGADEWPDVKKFVDEEVKSHPDMTLVGQSWRTIVFRNIKPASFAG